MIIIMLIRCVGLRERRMTRESGLGFGDWGLEIGEWGIHPSADINRWQTEMGSAVDPKNHRMHLRWGPP